MIGYIEGTWRHGAVLTAHGVGYRVESGANVDDGAHVSWWVTTVVRDNDIRLYGFSSPTDRSVFEALLAVPRVGPQMALAAVRDVGVEAIAAAVAARNAVPLTRAKGIGRKAAEMIISTVVLPEGLSGDVAGPGSELIEVLTEMGFDGDAAAAVITEILERRGDSPLDEADALAEALSLLAERS